MSAERSGARTWCARRTLFLAVEAHDDGLALVVLLGIGTIAPAAPRPWSRGFSADSRHVLLTTGRHAGSGKRRRAERSEILPFRSSSTGTARLDRVWCNIRTDAALTHHSIFRAASMKTPSAKPRKAASARRSHSRGFA